MHIKKFRHREVTKIREERITRSHEPPSIMGGGIHALMVGSLKNTISKFLPFVSCSFKTPQEFKSTDSLTVPLTDSLTNSLTHSLICPHNAFRNLAKVEKSYSGQTLTMFQV